MVCWPMKVSIVCNLVENFGGACDASKVLDEGFGKNVIRLKQIEDNLLSDQSKFEIKYATMSPINSLAVK